MAAATGNEGSAGSGCLLFKVLLRFASWTGIMSYLRFVDVRSRLSEDGAFGTSMVVLMVFLIFALRLYDCVEGLSHSWVEMPYLLARSL